MSYSLRNSTNRTALRPIDTTIIPTTIPISHSFLDRVQRMKTTRRERERERFAAVGIETVTVSIRRIASITVRMKGKRSGLRNNRIRRKTAATRISKSKIIHAPIHSDLSAQITSDLSVFLDNDSIGIRNCERNGRQHLSRGGRPFAYRHHVES